VEEGEVGLDGIRLDWIGLDWNGMGATSRGKLQGGEEKENFWKPRHLTKR
jgi:hypothetical protein